MADGLEMVVDGLGFIEGLRWRDGRLWFSDFSSRRVRSMDPAGQLRDEAWVPGQPSGLGFTPDGGLLVVSTHDAHLLRYDGERHFVVADVGAVYRGGLNDMLTTEDGRCYISAFPAPLVGEPTALAPLGEVSVPLFLVDLSGKVSVVAEGLKIPNGIAITADGGTLLVAETMANRISAFDVRADGSLGARRTYAELGDRNPDGISIDSRGRLWVSCILSSEFVRVDTSGAIGATIPVPGRWAVTCAVGESDDELWCATALTSIEDYMQGRATGAIMRWRA